MTLLMTLADIANATVLSDRIPESASLLVFAAGLVASAVMLRRILARRDGLKAVRAESK